VAKWTGEIQCEIEDAKRANGMKNVDCMGLDQDTWRAVQRYWESGGRVDPSDERLIDAAIARSSAQTPNLGDA
jgi:hypothetical protein